MRQHWKEKDIFNGFEAHKRDRGISCKRPATPNRDNRIIAARVIREQKVSNVQAKW
jgi:hypothetical protein